MAAPQKMCLDKAARYNHNLLIALVVTWAAIASVFFALVYVYGEHPAYIWDSRSYWEKYFTYGAAFHDSIRHWLSLLVGDILHSDNNGLPSNFLLPFYKFFGGCREAYIVGLVVFYLVPAAVLSALVACRATFTYDRPDWHKWFIAFFFLAVSCPQWWSTTLEGLPDVIGCIPLLLFLSVFQKDSLNKPLSLRRILYIGILLWLPFLFRRWYAFTIVSLFVTMTIFGLFEYYWARHKTPSKKNSDIVPWCLTRNLALIFMVSALCALCVQGGFIRHIIHTPYADLYSAYQVLDWREHFTKFYYHFGLFVILMSLLGIVLGVKEKSTRSITLFAVANIAITTKLFTMTQAFTVQHYVPIAAWLLLLQAITIKSMWHYLSNNRIIRPIFFVLYGMISLVYFYNILIAPVPEFSGVLMTETYYQRKLENYSEYARLARDLETLLGDKKKVAVFSSNGYLCDSILQSLSYEKLSKNIHFASQVDKRDHFDAASLLTDYVVVANPVQLHLRPSDQQVITIPATQILNHTGIGMAYERLPDNYTLANGAQASIYQKTRPFYIDEVTLLFEEFFKSYPEWRPQYGEIEKLYLTGNYTMGDIWGKVEIVGSNEILMHPGEHTDTIAGFENPNTKINHIHLRKVSFNIPAEVKKSCPDANGVIAKVETDGIGIYKEHIAVGEPDKELTLPSQWHSLKFVINNNGASACDLLHVHFSFVPGG